MLKQVSLIATLLSVVSCSSIPSPDTVCPPVNRVVIPDAEIPTVTSANTKIAILPVKVGFKDDAASKVAVKLRKTIENEVNRAGGKFLDRDLADRLAKEISIAEGNNEASRNNAATESSTIVIASEIENIDYNSNFTAGYVSKNIITGKKMWVEPSCAYDVTVKASVKLIDRATGNVIQDIDISGDQSKITDTYSSRCNLSVNEYATLATAAVNEALADDARLRNALAPSAPILELRQCEEGAMVLVDMGRNLNIIPTTNVKFYRLSREYDNELVPTLYGEGRVVDVQGAGITQTKSWIAIADETAAKVQKGDKAQIQFKNCDSMFDLECQLK